MSGSAEKSRLRLLDGDEAPKAGRPKPESTLSDEAVVIVKTKLGKRVAIPFALLPHINTMRRLLANPEKGNDSLELQETLSALLKEAENFSVGTRENLRELFPNRIP